jgi:outer membrane receptor protein involved in Fe transport
VQAQYLGPTQVDPDANPGTYDFPRVDDVVYINTSLSYDVSEQFQVRLIVDNLFDTGTPFPTPGGGGRVTYFDGILGRYFKVGARVRF